MELAEGLLNNCKKLGVLIWPISFLFNEMKVLLSEMVSFDFSVSLDSKKHENRKQLKMYLTWSIHFAQSEWI